MPLHRSLKSYSTVFSGHFKGQNEAVMIKESHPMRMRTNLSANADVQNASIIDALLVSSKASFKCSKSNLKFIYSALSRD